MNKIKILRDKYSLSQVEMAVILECTQGNVGLYEREGQSLPVERAYKFIHWAKVTHGDVLTLDDVYEMPELAKEA